MKFAVIGCGSIGRRHLANLMALRAGDVAVCDIDSSRVEEAATAFGVRGFRVTDDVLAWGPDGVVVCTPTHQHVPVALAAIAAGAHVFVEKPLAASLDGVAALERRAASAGRAVLVGCNMRFHPGITHLKRALDSGLLRSPLVFRAHFSHSLPNWRPGRDYRLLYSARRSQGGGIVMEAVHEIDYLRWLGGEVTAVEAIGGRFSALEIDSEDLALLLLRFSAGGAGLVHLDYLRPVKSRGCEVIGEEGLLSWTSEGKTPERVRVACYSSATGAWEELYRTDDYDANEMYRAELQHFLDCVAGNSRPLLDVPGGRRVLELALAARAQVEEAMSAGEAGPTGMAPRADGSIPVTPRPLVASEAFAARARAVIPSLSQTFSKGPTQYVQGVAPMFLRRGQGARVWDVDGNEYIDYPMGLGPVILGHNYPAVTDAVTRQLREGVSFTLPHPLEVEVAEQLVEMIPCAEMVRFGKNGSDATAGAVRVARAYTDRDLIACCGYHGWQDWYVGTTTRSRGVPDAVRRLTIPFQYNDIASLERVFAEHPGRIAAVILEPIGVVEPSNGFLQRVAEITRREGALLVFDEVVTGFRLALGGAQEYFGIVPDIGCFGKGMANGFPIAAVVGRREIMELFDEVFFSFTFGGETASLAAARATIVELRERNVVEHLWTAGRRLRDGYNALAREAGLDGTTACIGLPPRTTVGFKDRPEGDALVLKSLMQQECLKRGVLFGAGHNISFSHWAVEIDYTLAVYCTTLGILADAIKTDSVKQRLEGDPVRPVFRRL